MFVVGRMRSVSAWCRLGVCVPGVCRARARSARGEVPAHEMLRSGAKPAEKFACYMWEGYSPIPLT
eukprot:scaffold53253_cov65-Phaeocystis_antarctica.AAC.6